VFINISRSWIVDGVSAEFRHYVFSHDNNLLGAVPDSARVGGENSARYSQFKILSY